MNWHARITKRGRYIRYTLWQSKGHKGTLVFTEEEWQAFSKNAVLSLPECTYQIHEEPFPKEG